MHVSLAVGHDALERWCRGDDVVVRKGFPAETEAYSCFHDILRNPTGLHDLLQRHKITELFICGTSALH